MTRRGMIGLLAGVAITALGGCGQTDGDGKPSGAGRTWPPFRYRLTVEVETPKGLRTGSSVIEVRVRQASAIAIPSPRALSSEVHGEATAVDLPDGRTLFALLRSETTVDWAAGAAFIVIKRQTTAEQVASPDPFGTNMQRVLALQGVHALPRWVPPPPDGPPTMNKTSGYPMLVTFGNIADPKTVKKVDPDDLAATFGSGVKLKKITVERTNDEVTTHLRTRLPWIFGMRGWLKPSPCNEANPENLCDLGPLSFSTEFAK